MFDENTFESCTTRKLFAYQKLDGWCTSNGKLFARGCPRKAQKTRSAWLITICDVVDGEAPQGVVNGTGADAISAIGKCGRKSELMGRSHIYLQGVPEVDDIP